MILVGHGIGNMTSIKTESDAAAEKRHIFHEQCSLLLKFLFFGQLAYQVLWFLCHFPFF